MGSAFDRIDEHFEVIDDDKLGARIKVIGVGGAGGNALNNMMEHGLIGVELIAVNTDKQALARCAKGIKTVQIGEKITGGLGAGSDPEKGRMAAEESETLLIEMLEDSTDMVFITAGLGGGTGTGASPVIARIAREMGILTVAVVTKPFSWEMRQRHQNAERGLEELSKHVDAMIVIQNDRVLVEGGTTIIDAFKRVDDVLRQGVQSITDIINIPGYINVDLNDVKTVMESGGMALMAIAEAEGEDRSREAVERALSNPLVECSGIRGAKGVLYNITSGRDFKTDELKLIGDMIKEEVGEEAKVIFGLVIDENMNGKVRLTVIATGFDKGIPSGAKGKRFDSKIREQMFRDGLEFTKRASAFSIRNIEEEEGDAIPRVIPKFLKGFLEEI